MLLFFFFNCSSMDFLSIKSFSKPFPFIDSVKEHFLIALFFGVFTFLFLMVFEPFTIDEIESNKFLYVFGYGLVTFGVLFFTLRLFAIIANPSMKEGWTVGKMLLLICAETFVIAIMTWLYSYPTELYIDEFESPWTYVFYTFSIGSIPIAFFIVYLEKKLEKKNQKEAVHVFADIASNKSLFADEAVHIVSNNNEIKLTLNELLCIKAFGNYVEVYYQKEKVLKKELLRQSLSQIGEQLKAYPSLKQCHRSYIVNFDKIEKVNGNARNFNLHLSVLDFVVPVSRNFPTRIIKTIQN